MGNRVTVGQILRAGRPVKESPVRMNEVGGWGLPTWILPGLAGVIVFFAFIATKAALVRHEIPVSMSWDAFFAVIISLLIAYGFLQWAAQRRHEIMSSVEKGIVMANDMNMSMISRIKNPFLRWLAFNAYMLWLTSMFLEATETPFEVVDESGQPAEEYADPLRDEYAELLELAGFELADHQFFGLLEVRGDILDLVRIPISNGIYAAAIGLFGLSYVVSTLAALTEFESALGGAAFEATFCFGMVLLLSVSFRLANVFGPGRTQFDLNKRFRRFVKKNRVIMQFTARRWKRSKQDSDRWKDLLAVYQAQVHPTRSYSTDTVATNT